MQQEERATRRRLVQRRTALVSLLLHAAVYDCLCDPLPCSLAACSRRSAPRGGGSSSGAPPWRRRCGWRTRLCWPLRRRRPRPGLPRRRGAGRPRRARAWRGVAGGSCGDGRRGLNLSNRTQSTDQPPAVRSGQGKLLTHLINQVSPGLRVLSIYGDRLRIYWVRSAKLPI